MRVAYDVDGRPVEMTDTVKSAPSYVLEYSLPATCWLDLLGLLQHDNCVFCFDTDLMPGCSSCPALRNCHGSGAAHGPSPVAGRVSGAPVRGTTAPLTCGVPGLLRGDQVGPGRDGAQTHDVAGLDHEPVLIRRRRQDHGQ